MAVGPTNRSVALAMLPYMWRAWWRKLEMRGVWHGANAATVTALALLGLIGSIFGNIFAFESLRDGATPRGLMVLEGCLNAVLVGWLFVPIMVGSTTAEGRGLQPIRMGQFPLKIGDLLAIGLMGRMVQPVYWILAGTSLCVFLPLSVVADPLAGVAAGLLFVAFAALLAWSVELFGSALFSSRHGREMMMLGVLLLMIPMVLMLNADFDMIDGDLFCAVGEHSVLLLNEDASDGLILKSRIISPSRWVVGAASGQATLQGILLLAIALATSAWLARVSLRRVMLHPPGTLRSRKGVPRAIGQVRGLSVVMGPLLIKEIRYLSRTLDHLMSVGLSLIALVWILLRPEHMQLVLPLAALNIVVNQAAIPLNNFGLDGSGADRYRLVPLSGRQVLMTKNLAYFSMVGIHMIPLLLGGIFKGGAMLALATLLGTAAACLITAAGGNVVSIKSPSPRAFFNFDTKEQTGGGLALFLSVLVWVMPAGVYFALVWFGMWAVVLGMTGLLVIAWFIYGAWLTGSGRSFEESGETMRERLNKE
jgi:hypothetical protein